MSTDLVAPLEGTTIYVSGDGGVHVLGFGTDADWLAELGVASVEVVPVEHLREKDAEVERLRAALDNAAWRAEAGLNHPGLPATTRRVFTIIARESRAALEASSSRSGESTEVPAPAHNGCVPACSGTADGEPHKPWCPAHPAVQNEETTDAQ